MPAPAKVTVREPVENTPVSNDPLSARAEWGIPSWLVQVTLSPTSTVTAAGTNWAPLIATLALAATALPVSAMSRVAAAVANTRRAIRSAR